MFNYLLLLFFICLLFVAGYPKITSVTTDDDAVVLLEEFEFRVVDENEGIYRYKVKIRINNEQGKKYSSSQSLNENEFRLVSDVQARVRDLDGNVLAELDEDDIHFSTMGNNISDGKRYWFSLYSPKYPYIFEVEQEYEIKSLLYWPPWTPGFDVPTVLSRYRLIQEIPVPFRNYALGINDPPMISTTGNDSVWTWEIKDMPERKKIYRCPPELKIQPLLLFSALQFQLGEYRVNTQSWDNFAQWIREMYSGQNLLPKETIARISELISDTMPQMEKITRITRFLQENTRYVAIELGTGGWKPYPAEWVMKNKMGDCKDLSTCLISLLDVAGIKAYPALIKTRDNGILYADFPSNQFNHVIVFVPLDEDTVWIETTSDYFAPGHLPYQDQGCNVLVIKEEQGQIIQTPMAPSKENYAIRKVSGSLNSINKLKFEARSSFGGESKIPFVVMQRSQKKERIIESLSDYMGQYENTVKLQDFEFRENGSELYLEVKGELANFVSQSRKRVFLNPNVFSRIDLDEDLEQEERAIPVYFNFPYRLIDSVEVTLPVISSLESAPEPVEMDREFARFKTDYIYSGKKLFYVRFFEIKTRMIPAEIYRDYLEFMHAVEDSDNRKFVFLKY